MPVDTHTLFSMQSMSKTCTALAVLIAAGRCILKKSSFREMTEIPFPGPGQTNGYALGIRRIASRGTVALLHSGWGLGANGLFMVYPEFKLGAFLFCNSSDFSVQGSPKEILGKAIDAKIGRQKNRDPQEEIIRPIRMDRDGTRHIVFKDI